MTANIVPAVLFALLALAALPWPRPRRWALFLAQLAVGVGLPALVLVAALAHFLPDDLWPPAFAEVVAPWKRGLSDISPALGDAAWLVLAAVVVALGLAAAVLIEFGRRLASLSAALRSYERSLRLLTRAGAAQAAASLPAPVPAATEVVLAAAGAQPQPRRTYAELLFPVAPPGDPQANGK